MNRKKRTKVTSRQEEIVGILMITLAVLVFISLLTYNPQEQPGKIEIGKIDNQLGIAGVYIANFLIVHLIGWPSLVIPIIVLLIGWDLFRGNQISKSLRWSAYLLIFAIYTSVILAIPEVTDSGKIEISRPLAGHLGGWIAQTLLGFLGAAGAMLILLALIMITVIGATNISFSTFMTTVGRNVNMRIQSAIAKMRALKKKRKTKSTSSPSRRNGFGWRDGEPPSKSPPESTEPHIQSPAKPSQLEIDLKQGTEGEPKQNRSSDNTIHENPARSGNYVFPPLALLSTPSIRDSKISKEEMFANARILEERLLEFGVQGKVTDIRPGPVITRYEVEPAPGVKISRISSLSDDLALAMRAKSIRIVAPIPGKGAVGIELPNREREIVSLNEVIKSDLFQKSTSPLTIALGKSIEGKPYIANLDEMPHLLIAGSTGSGKSICINSIIASILYKAHPTQVQLVMIDPKRLELSIYNNLRSHHLNYREDLNEEVVTTPANAISILNSMERVMENRYEILARAGVRNILDYNKKLRNGQLSNIDHEDPFEPLEYIVLIIDELADLMLMAAKEVEEPIARLTQMSRAVGIHLIVATQRPSVDVITGVIKANFPARLAFLVASKTDSRTILDANGAEKLLGMGDMLFVPPGYPEAVRLHGTFVSSEEIERIIAHIRKQPKYPKQKLPAPKEETTALFDDAVGFSSDKLFQEAAKLVVRHQQGSISLLQRRLKVGYARAARLIDELESAGVVGPFDGSKAREVLVGDEEELADMGFA